MANAKRCDVCGRFYVNEDKNFSVNGYKAAVIAILSVNENNLKKYDVCDECAKDVFDLLEGRCCIHREKAGD